MEGGASDGKGLMGTDRGRGSGAGPYCCPVLSCHSCCMLIACPPCHLVVVASSSHGSFIVWWLVVGVSGAWLWSYLCGCPFVFTVGVHCCLGIHCCLGVCCCLWVVVFVAWVVISCCWHCASHRWPSCYGFSLFSHLLVGQVGRLTNG